MSDALWAWNNYVSSAAMFASSQSSNLPVENLQDETGSASMAWQTAAGTVQGVVLRIVPRMTGQLWRVFGVFRSNLTAQATVKVTLYNNIAAPSSQWAGSTGGPSPGRGQAIIVAPSAIAADYCEITIDDNGNLDGFLNIPLCFAGPAWQPLSNPSWDSAQGADNRTDEQTSIGGQEYPAWRWSRRRREISMQGLRASEVATVEDMDRTARQGGNTLFVPSVVSPTINDDALYGRLSATADVGFPYQAADRRSWRARLTERL